MQTDAQPHTPRIAIDTMDALNNGLRTVFGAVNTLRHFENSPTQIEAEELALVSNVLDDAFYKMSEARDELEAERVAARPELAERIAELRAAKAMTPAEAMAAPADGTTPIMRLRKSKDDLLIAKCELFLALRQQINADESGADSHDLPIWAEYAALEQEIIASRPNSTAALSAKADACRIDCEICKGDGMRDAWAVSILNDIRRIGRAAA